MATFFSDHYTATGVGQLALTAGYFPHTGISHGRLRMSTAYVTIPTATSTNADTIRLMSFKSGDRIHALIVDCDAADGASVTDIGLHRSGRNHDGAVIDLDLFADALDTHTAAIDQTDLFDQATTLDNFDRGKPLWALANIGAGTYTVDPVEDWDLTASIPTKPDADIELRVEVQYTSGD